MPLPPYSPGLVVDPLASVDFGAIKGKSVIVTGGASGLGEAYVRKFAGAGAFVTIGDLNAERGSKIAAELGSNTRFVRCDVLNWDEQVQLFKTAVAESPSKSCDIVVANAGISGQDKVWVLDEGEEPVKPDLSIYQVNSIGVLYTAKLALHYFNLQPETDERDRCLILKASLAGYLDIPGALQYNSSKWAVRGLMNSLRRTSWQRGVRVNLIAPWFIETRIMSAEVVAYLHSAGIDFALAEDSASAVLHVAADKSINGRALTILPRNWAEKGYRDLEHDDYEKNDYIFGWQEVLLNTTHRILASPVPPYYGRMVC